MKKEQLRMWKGHNCHGFLTISDQVSHCCWVRRWSAGWSHPQLGGLQEEVGAGVKNGSMWTLPWLSSGNMNAAQKPKDCRQPYWIRLKIQNGLSITVFILFRSSGCQVNTLQTSFISTSPWHSVASGEISEQFLAIISANSLFPPQDLY